MAKLSGKFYRTPTDRESYEIFEAEASFIWTIANWIQPEFGLQPKSMPVFGLDQYFLDLWQGTIQITVGWDNWSGCFVMSDGSIQSEQLVREIGAFIERKLIDFDND